MAEPLVAILLSTYNGERFLGEQLDSLLRQTHRNTRIVVRDDGSSDGTPGILRRYAREHDNLKVSFGANIGFVASFFQLLEHAPGDAGYCCFSDQDDVWQEDKLTRGVRRLQGATGPALYFTDVQVVDGALQPLGYAHNPVPRGAVFENALVQNVATGCTMMFNTPALAALRGRPLRLSEILYHDWWVYAVLAGIGEVFYDPYPSMKYRQHGTNAIGSPDGVRRWTAKVRRHLGPASLRIRRQAAELLRVYSNELPEQRKRVLEEFVRSLQSANWMERARYALRSPLFRQDRIDTAFLKLLITIGRV